MDLSQFMAKHNTTDFSDEVTKIVNFINALAPQLASGIGTMHTNIGIFNVP